MNVQSYRRRTAIERKQTGAGRPASFATPKDVGAPKPATIKSRASSLRRDTVLIQIVARLSSRLPRHNRPHAVALRWAGAAAPASRHPLASHTEGRRFGRRRRHEHEGTCRLPTLVMR